MSEDEQEALSLKHNIARIVRLSSGRFALFDPWSNAEGLPLLRIGTLEEVGRLIPSADEVTEYLAETRESRHASTVREGNDLLASLGLLKLKPPTEPIRRRI